MSMPPRQGRPLNLIPVNRLRSGLQCTASLAEAGPRASVNSFARSSVCTRLFGYLLATFGERTAAWAAAHEANQVRATGEWDRGWASTAGRGEGRGASRGSQAGCTPVDCTRTRLATAHGSTRSCARKTSEPRHTAAHPHPHSTAQHTTRQVPHTRAPEDTHDAAAATRRSG